MQTTFEPMAPKTATPKVEPANSLPLNCFLLLSDKGFKLESNKKQFKEVKLAGSTF